MKNFPNPPVIFQRIQGSTFFLVKVIHIWFGDSSIFIIFTKRFLKIWPMAWLMKWGCQQSASFASGNASQKGVSSKTSSLPNNDCSSCQWQLSFSQFTGAKSRFKIMAMTGMGFSRSPYSQPESHDPRIVASSAAELAAGETLLAMVQSGMSAPVSHKREAVQEVALNLLW